MRREEHIDYHLVADHHVGIHMKLEQWARWVRPRQHGWQTAPMFRQYRSKAWQWERPEPRAALNLPEAMEMERAVSGLPDKHREAIRWAYVFPGSPSAIARKLGVNPRGLMDLVSAARTMLINRTKQLS